MNDVSRRVGLLSTSILAVFATSFFFDMHSASAGAVLPTGGHFAAGQGSIGSGTGALAVDQTSRTGIIDWNNFSVGKDATVSIDNGSGATLNRVTGQNISQIAGSLNATGTLYLINPQGVIVNGSGHIVTGGSFVASTGNGALTGVRGTAGGNIRNAGSITAANVSLIGHDVSSSGAIAVNRGGRIWLESADTTSVGGSLNADNAAGKGGTIVATGRKIDIGGNTTISASGRSGGTVLLGGDIHGGAIAADDFVKRNVADAGKTTVAHGAQISADSTAGKGGNVVIWSNGHTSFEGAVAAKGTTSGGFAEVSSRRVLAYTGTADLTAQNGKTGTLLLDPENVTIENGTTSGGSLSGGTFTPTGDNSVLSVADLEAALATANVEVTTGSTGGQAGDITVRSPITWSANTLTLDAYRSIHIDAAVAASGTAGLALITNSGGKGGTYAFNGGDATFANTSETLTIDGIRYKLVSTMRGLQNIHLTGHYALANSLNASSISNWVPLGTDEAGTIENSGKGFSGVFEGLGNKISNLTLNAPNTSRVGLFGYTSGTIRDIGLVGGSVTGKNLVGALAGVNDGLIAGVYTNDTVNGTSRVGGLVGVNDFTIEQSDATGTVNGADDVGGLVGENIDAIVENSYTTGAVNSSGSNYEAGGLVGYNNGGLISATYATGAVTNTGSNDFVGGLVGWGRSGVVKNSYATGAVSGGQNTAAGGLVGYNGNSAIRLSYSTGTVGGSGNIGGLVGVDNGVISGSYFDTDMSGIASQNGAGNIQNDAGITGLTTAQLQSGLPPDFASSIWGESTSINDGLPYLLALKSSY